MHAADRLSLAHSLDTENYTYALSLSLSSTFYLSKHTVDFLDVLWLF